MNRKQEAAREIQARRERLGLKKTSRRKKPTKIQHPDSIDREYQRRINSLIDDIENHVKQFVLPQVFNELDLIRSYRPDSNIRHDNNVDKISSLFQSATQTLEPLVEGVDPDLKKILQSAAGFNKEQINGAIRSVIGVDLFMNEPWLENEVQSYVEENRRLIKSIKDESVSEIEGITMRGLQEGKTNNQIAEEIEERFGSSKKRAKTIARDQIAKLNGNLTELRQKNMGLETYIWRNSQDTRVAGNPSGLYPNAKPSHWNREGNVYRWDSPPEGGHPGRRVNCRCYAEPNISELRDITQIVDVSSI